MKTSRVYIQQVTYLYEPGSALTGVCHGNGMNICVVLVGSLLNYVTKTNVPWNHLRSNTFFMVHIS